MMSKKRPLCLATHNGNFHADEVTAVALLVLFEKVNLCELHIIRTRDQHLLAQADIVLDVGAVYDEKTLRFDHHQIVAGSISSAGLVWSWIKKYNTMDYPEIDALITLIDAHDCGIKSMPDFSFAHIIASYNTDNPREEELQLEAFYRAIDVALSLLRALKQKPEQRCIAQALIEQADIEIIGKQQVLVLPKYCQGWSEFINGQTPYKDITHVIWHAEQRDEWCIQVTAINSNDFTLGYAKLKPDSVAKFVHQSGFFAVYRSKQAIFKMLQFLD